MEPRSDTSPKAETVDNRSLHLGLQQSEGRRLSLLLVVLAATAGLGVLRHEMGGLVLGIPSVFVARMALWAAVAGYALLLLALVRRANQRSVLLPTWLWGVTSVLESLVPTAALWILLKWAPVDPLQLLTAPVILLYGIFIVVSVLRLRPWLSLLAGVMCAGGHAALFLHLALRSGGTLPAGSFAYYLSYPVFLLLTGVAAAQVSLEVRKHFLASLREAETRRKLDLVQNELNIARVIQQALMPERPPQVPGFDIAGWNRPADETGGDYYDWQVLADGRVAIVIADVSGHGLGPALLMAVCRAYARACVPVGLELRSALSRVNSLLHGDVSAGRFVTFAVMILEPTSGQFELLSAGHGPILHLHAKDARVEEFATDGTPLGILEDEDYGVPQPRRMEPSDVLLFVTDGFTEWARSGDGEQYGTERLSEFVLKNIGLDAKTLIDRMDADVRTFGPGTRQADDMTAVVVRRLEARPQ